MPETLERFVPATSIRIWELWTTAEGIARWWAPQGFRTDVIHLDLRPGGELVYRMTAVDPEQVAFMQQHGMPLVTESRKYFTEIERPCRLGYRSVIDFVPDHEPYEQLTEVDLEPVDGGTRVHMQMQALHDDVWTQRLLAGRANELENLAALAAAD